MSKTLFAVWIFIAIVLVAPLVLSSCGDDPCRGMATMMEPGDRQTCGNRHKQGEIRMIDGKAYWICECPKSGSEGE